MKHAVIVRLKDSSASRWDSIQDRGVVLLATRESRDRVVQRFFAIQEVDSVSYPRERQQQQPHGEDEEDDEDEYDEVPPVQENGQPHAEGELLEIPDLREPDAWRAYIA